MREENLEGNVSGTERRGDRPYTKPQLRRIELTVEESLVSGCKVGSEADCYTPPEPGWESGS